jgi:hypothetical protein
MRYLGILVLGLSLSAPAMARKHHSAKASRHKPRVVARIAPAPQAAAPPSEPAPPPPRVERVQENDDEVPGQKQKK